MTRLGARKSPTWLAFNLRVRHLLMRGVLVWIWWTLITFCNHPCRAYLAQEPSAEKVQGKSLLEISTRSTFGPVQEAHSAEETGVPTKAPHLERSGAPAPSETIGCNELVVSATPNTEFEPGGYLQSLWPALDPDLEARKAEKPLSQQEEGEESGQERGSKERRRGPQYGGVPWSSAMDDINATIQDPYSISGREHEGGVRVAAPCSSVTSASSCTASAGPIFNHRGPASLSRRSESPRTLSGVGDSQDTTSCGSSGTYGATGEKREGEASSERSHAWTCKPKAQTRSKTGLCHREAERAGQRMGRLRGWDFATDQSACRPLSEVSSRSLAVVCDSQGGVGCTSSGDEYCFNADARNQGDGGRVQRRWDFPRADSSHASSPDSGGSTATGIGTLPNAEWRGSRSHGQRTRGHGHRIAAGWKADQSQDSQSIQGLDFTLAGGKSNLETKAQAGSILKSPIFPTWVQWSLDSGQLSPQMMHQLSEDFEPRRNLKTQKHVAFDETVHFVAFHEDFPEHAVATMANLADFHDRLRLLWNLHG